MDVHVYFIANSDNAFVCVLFDEVFSAKLLYISYYFTIIDIPLVIKRTDIIIIIIRQSRQRKNPADNKE